MKKRAEKSTEKVVAKDKVKPTVRKSFRKKQVKTEQEPSEKADDSVYFREFVKYAHMIGAEKLVRCSSGNLSVRAGDKVYISGTGTWLESITEDQIAVLDIKSGKRLNEVTPSIESKMHLELFKKRKDIDTILHFQSPYATTIACLENQPEDFNVTLEIPLHVGGKIPAIPYLKPGSSELAAEVAKQMKEDIYMVILNNHGQVTCGKGFQETLQRAIFFEAACRIIILSGGEATTLDEHQIADLKTQHSVNK